MNSSVAALENNKTSRFSMAQIARKLVWRQLEKIHTGSIVLYEQGVRHSFGEALLPGADLYSEMHIHDMNCYTDILTGGSIGASEAYMTGDWTSPDLTSLVRVMAKNMDILDQIEGGFASISKPMLKWFHRHNQNTEKGSRRNIASHYDLGNDFFKVFLDPTMMYSSGIFPYAGATMQEASENKLRRICEKLQLSADDHVVEIGTGWGGFAIYAAKHYGCKVTTTTISEQQFLLAKERVKEAGLDDKITLLMEDYRKLEGTYDKLVSIEMIEAVGWQFYDTFFEKCASLLKPNGSMLIQAITIEDQRYEKAKNDVDFIQKYIFPGSCIPSINALNTASMNSSDMRLIHLDDFAEHYATTLRTWSKTLADNLDKVRSQGYSEDFIRMWFFYLSYCEGGFMERTIGVSHLVFAKPDFRKEIIQ
ncbi:SAM-dependent methyltransferase [Alkalimarinus alittae]|uniref:Cyclopropane-fatty-acyl-phospholipid synthase family protein n=1 Tax=Alkalimarinus alittae TaxID=2961619 RepID=A0ABY6N700_9ALTE|nr:cyclopropane-fatty-acyl-phospholipid synthase family protein [Alkalimarinus alittae]UZE97772.1 cyclopropane-fatty-acyl-phospholipid synthase family protein [Alkalimarinus alittae]